MSRPITRVDITLAKMVTRMTNTANVFPMARMTHMSMVIGMGKALVAMTATDLLQPFRRMAKR